MNSKPKGPEPKSGDVVTCYFPHVSDSLDIQPGPDLRPAFVVKVEDELDRGIFLTVAYGSGQHTPDKNGRRTASDVYFHMEPGSDCQGLKVQTSFNMAKTVRVPFTSTWFDCWPGRITIGLCHVRKERLAEVKAAWEAGKTQVRPPQGRPVAVVYANKRRVVPLAKPV